MVPIKLLPRLRILSKVSAVKTEKLGKGPVTDAKPHGSWLKEMDCVEVGSAVRADRFSVMLLLLPPNEHTAPYFEHSAKADGGSVPLSALPLRSKPVKLTIVPNESGSVPFMFHPFRLLHARVETC